MLGEESRGFLGEGVGNSEDILVGRLGVASGFSAAGRLFWRNPMRARRVRRVRSSPVMRLRRMRGRKVTRGNYFK